MSLNNKDQNQTKYKIPRGVRTPVSSVKGKRPWPHLDDGDTESESYSDSDYTFYPVLNYSCFLFDSYIYIYTYIIQI